MDFISICFLIITYNYIECSLVISYNLNINHILQILNVRGYTILSDENLSTILWFGDRAERKTCVLTEIISAKESSISSLVHNLLIRCQNNSGSCHTLARPFYWPSRTKFPIIAFRAFKMIIKFPVAYLRHTAVVEKQPSKSIARKEFALLCI